jgi:DNA-binding MarR family transcriptional regulator
VRLHDGRRVRDLNSYVPYFLFTAHNALSRGALRQYLNEFGVGIAEWRVVSTLAMEPGITARQVCDMIALDKAAVSRSLHVLATRALAKSAPGTNDPRHRTWRLTEGAGGGRNLHDRIIDIALARERRMIEGVAPEDLETFLQVMRTMRGNIDALVR